MPSKIPAKKHLVIAGAGISSLALGWSLKKRFRDQIDLTILESQNRVGGWIQTQNEDGFLFELGPRSCRPHGSGLETLSLIEELGLQQELIFASPAARQRYLYANKRLTCLPSGILSLLSSPLTFSLIKALWHDRKTPKSDPKVDESIAEFTSRRLGHEAAELFFNPLVAGIYAGDTSKLSMKSCFPQLYEWEQQHGSLLRGAFAKKQKSQQLYSPFVLESQKKGLFTLQKGIEALTNALAERLKESIKLNSHIVGIEFKEGRSLLLLGNQEIIRADHVFMAIPPANMASLMSSHHQAVREALSGIPSASVGVVSLGYRQPILKQQGFGYLIPSHENEKVLGIVWDSSAFPTQNSVPEQTRLTAMIGEAHLPTGLDAEAILEKLAIETVSRHMGIHNKPDVISVKIANNAIPQYHVGHAERIKIIESGLKELPASVSILGNGYYGISVNDCIAKARSIAEKWTTGTTEN